VLQYVAVCCSMLQCVAAYVYHCCGVLQRDAVCCSMLQCVAVCCSRHVPLLRCVAVYCSMLHCVAVCCSKLQYDAACCSLHVQDTYLPHTFLYHTSTLVVRGKNTFHKWMSALHMCDVKSHGANTFYKRRTHSSIRRGAHFLQHTIVTTQ